MRPIGRPFRVEIGDDVRIGRDSILGDDVTIGLRTRIDRDALIGDGVNIGANVQIEPRRPGRPFEVHVGLTGGTRVWQGRSKEK